MLRPGLIAAVGVVLAVISTLLLAGSGTRTGRPVAVASERAVRHRARAGREATPGQVLSDPDLLGALVHGREPVDPHDTVGNAIISGRLLFIGASYSLGLGATGRPFTYPYLLAARLHQPYQVNAVSGTGFQNPGAHHQGTFAQRLVQVPNDPPPKVVVIQGGRDDIKYPIAKEYAAALGTIRLAQQRFDEAQVVLLGPIPAHLPVTPRLLQIRDAIRSAAATAHAGFIDPIAEDWITDANEKEYAGRVPGHPNNAGYAYITGRMVDELHTALAASQAPALPDET